MPIDLAPLSALAGQAAQAGRDAGMGGDRTVGYKLDGTVVTGGDLAASAAIREILEATGIPILDEEGSQTVAPLAGWRWVVDPIDGSRLYAQKKDAGWATLVGLEYQDVPVVGAICTNDGLWIANSNGIVQGNPQITDIEGGGIPTQHAQGRDGSQWVRHFGEKRATALRNIENLVSVRVDWHGPFIARKHNVAIVMRGAAWDLSAPYALGVAMMGAAGKTLYQADSSWNSVAVIGHPDKVAEVLAVFKDEDVTPIVTHTTINR